MAKEKMRDIKMELVNNTNILCLKIFNILKQNKIKNEVKQCQPINITVKNVKIHLK